ncbi:hypothetical protein [Synechococcus sp. N19]|nr:hypothetical protein [Synechococcus sp. N19]
MEAERFHDNTDDLEAQVIAKFKELPPVEWTWDKFSRGQTRGAGTRRN